MSNSVDPDETDHMSRLIWIYAVCKILLLSPVEMKELRVKPDPAEPGYALPLQTV